MSFCPNCGTQLDAALKFCTNCGTALTQPQPAQHQQPYAQPQYQQPQVQQPYAPPPAPQPKKKTKAPLIIGGVTGVVALALVAVLVFTNGFGLFGGGRDNPGGNSDDSDIDIGDFNLIDADGRDWSKYDWTNFDPADLPVDLGKASFTVDKSATATSEYVPGEPLTLSVTDSAGATWTLDIPGHALMYPDTITITAVKDITADELGSFDGGVILEPDGLQFLEPATLTASGGGWGGDCILLTGGHDGSNLNFVEYETDENSATATTWHFSSQLGQKGPNWNQYDQQLLDQFRRAVGYAQDILKKPVKAPVPPSITFDVCVNEHRGNNDNKGNEKFFNELFEPEKSAMDSLYMAWAVLMNGRRISSTTYTDTVLAEIHEHYRNALVMRLLKKAKQLIDTYKYQEDRFMMIALAVPGLMSCKGATDFKVSSRQWEEPKDMAALRAEIQAEVEKWAKEVWNQYMRKLVEEHDYRAFHALGHIMLVYAFAVFINADNCPTYLGNALTFRVEWKMEHTMTTNGGVAGFRYNLSGEATVSMDQISEDKGYFGESAGEAKYDSYVEFTGHTTMPVLPEYSFIAELSDIDPCMKKTITVAIDQFGADTETGVGGDQVFTWNPGLMRVGTGVAYAENKDKDTGYYTFTPKIINGSAEAVNEKLVKPYNPANTNTLTIILHHEPKADVFMR